MKGVKNDTKKQKEDKETELMEILILFKMIQKKQLKFEFLSWWNVGEFNVCVC